MFKRLTVLLTQIQSDWLQKLREAKEEDKKKKSKFSVCYLSFLTLDSCAGLFALEAQYSLYDFQPHEGRISCPNSTYQREMPPQQQSLSYLVFFSVHHIFNEADGKKTASCSPIFW